MHQIARIFTVGRSQAVLLPPGFRFDVPEVFIWRDPDTGDVILSRKPKDWRGLLDAVAANKNDYFVLERRQTRGRQPPF